MSTLRRWVVPIAVIIFGVMFGCLPWVLLAALDGPSNPYTPAPSPTRSFVSPSRSPDPPGFRHRLYP